MPANDGSWGEMRSGRAASPTALLGMRVPDLHHHHHYSAIIIILIMIRANPTCSFGADGPGTYHATLLCHYQRVQTFDTAMAGDKSGPGGPIIARKKKKKNPSSSFESKMPLTACSPSWKTTIWFMLTMTALR
jgi:hypothetical protein